MSWCLPRRSTRAIRFAFRRRAFASGSWRFSAKCTVRTAAIVLPSIAARRRRIASSTSGSSGIVWARGEKDTCGNPSMLYLPLAALPECASPPTPLDASISSTIAQARIRSVHRRRDRGLQRIDLTLRSPQNWGRGGRVAPVGNAILDERAAARGRSRQDNKEAPAASLLQHVAEARAQATERASGVSASRALGP